MFRLTPTARGQLFRCTTLALGRGSYAQYLVEVSGRSELKGMKIAERGKLVAQWYKNLTPDEMTALKERAAAAPTPVRKSKKAKKNDDGAPKKKRDPSPYTLFVKEVYAEKNPEIMALPIKERLGAIGALWKKKQQQQGPGTDL